MVVLGGVGRAGRRRDGFFGLVFDDGDRVLAMDVVSRNLFLVKGTSTYYLSPSDNLGTSAAKWRIICIGPGMHAQCNLQLLDNL